VSEYYNGLFLKQGNLIRIRIHLLNQKQQRETQTDRSTDRHREREGDRGKIRWTATKTFHLQEFSAVNVKGATRKGLSTR